MIEYEIVMSDATDSALSRLDDNGQSLLLVARDGVVLGSIGANDTLRPEAAGVLQNSLTWDCHRWHS